MIQDLFVFSSTSLYEVLTAIDKNQRGFVLVVDESEKLLATLNDGDIRRGILAGLTSEDPVSRLLEIKAQGPYPTVITASDDTIAEELVRIMVDNNIRYIPLVDRSGRVVDVVEHDAVQATQNLPVEAVIMAGGFGKRLYPLTAETPKPMLPIGDKPLIQHTIEGLRDSGIGRVHISTFYLKEKITEYFGNGEALDTDIHYVSEDKPLGTAGAISQLGELSAPLLVVNGDIVTQVNYRAMVNFHREHQAAITVGVRQYSLHVPYGIIKSSGVFIEALEEKPTLNFMVNAGIYLLSPSIHSLIPQDTYFDMTDLIELLLQKQATVVSFPILEYWKDIGHRVDYEQAQRDIDNRDS